jgi:hypothetical protein
VKKKYYEAGAMCSSENSREEENLRRKLCTGMKEAWLF